MLSASSYRNLVAGTNRHAGPATTAFMDDEPTVEIPAFKAEEESPAPGEKQTGAHQIGAHQIGTHQIDTHQIDTHIDSLVKPLVDSAKPAEPKASTTLAPLDSLSIRPSRPARAEISAPELSPVPTAAPAPSLIPAEIPPCECNLDTASLASSGGIVIEPSPGWLPKPQDREVEPIPSRRRSVAFLRPQRPIAADSELALADLAASGIEFTPALDACEQLDLLENEAEPLAPAPGDLALIPSQIDPGSESLSEVLRALERSAEDLEESAIRAIQASFAECPTVPLLSEPLEILTAPAPPAEQWLRLPKLVFTAQPPSKAGIQALSAGPQTPTLAGPCLPLQLRNFTGSTMNQGRANKRSAAPTWMISVLVAMALFVGAGSLLQYLSANRDTHAATVPSSSSAGESASTLPAAQEHPGARFVEVAGLRVVTAPNRRPQLQYIVINHSAGELIGLNIRITVHSPNAPSGDPLFSVASVIPSLAANQSKEIRTDLDPSLKAASLPGWQSLHPEIQITRQ